MSSPTKSHRRSPKRARRPAVVRRSFALPAQLVEQVSEAAPEYAGNLNAAVRHALEDYVKRKEDEEFAREMERMAGDPQMRAISAELSHAFRFTLKDGLSDDPTW